MFKIQILNGVNVPFQELVRPTSHSKTASCKYDFYNLLSQIRGTTEPWRKGGESYHGLPLFLEKNKISLILSSIPFVLFPSIA